MISRNIGFVLSALAVFAIVWGCESATPYQAVGETQKYGFSDQMVEDDRAIVQFAGNSLTDQKTVETYMLYRAAELTREKGYDYFHVVKSETDEDRQFVPIGYSYAPYHSHFHCRYRPFGYAGYYDRYPFGRYSGRHRAALTLGVNYHGRYGAYGLRHGIYDPFFYSPLEIVRYEAAAEIIMGQGSKPNGSEYFDAAQVLTNLKGQIILPEMLE